MTDNLSPAKIRERANRPNTLVAFSNDEARLIADAIEFADASEIAYIEGEGRHMGDQWIAFEDDPQLSDDANKEIRESLDASLKYLEGRGLIERHPDQPWVRIKESSA